MRYLLYFLIYIYLSTGFIIGVRAAIAQDRYVYLIGNFLFAIAVGMFYAFLWLPETIADIACRITIITEKRERK